ncbi:hypothetical protein WR25_06694 [Diploscapter pachys]|uniref:Dynein heavy chain C-terminal domain-containing protein n=1 Tax=Diploscapter pachys TaxID=2018661 RepID=A0A2A2K0R5_9BILA|nr:hypothetical protein WR25_06694 [Diploscapter pachys]
MLRTYGQIEEAKRAALTCQSIFVLAWMHALLQERRTYIPQAWTKFYEFSNADVRVARVLIEQLTGQGGTDWEFIRGLLQFVIYGGRIESQFDSNVLVSYLNTLFNGQKITGQRGQQVASGIEIITADNIKEFVNHTAKSIPDEDEPALFGLPANIRFSWQLTEAEETVARMRNALFQCPDEWSNYWTGPRESAEYLNAVIFKAKSTQEILSASEKGDFLQNPVNLSMLFRPTTLLNALRQATARKMSKALDELRLVSSWDNRPQAGAVLSMQVKGIQLQGALFDGLLRETTSSSPPTTVAPPLALSWMPLDSSPASSSDSVLVPLYSDSDRQSLIASVTMPCRNPDQWNIAAVALFLK